MKKASIFGALAAVVALAIGLFVMRAGGGQSSVLLEDAVARLLDDGSVAITLKMTNGGGPIKLSGLSSPEAETSALSGTRPLALPAGSAPALALDGVHGTLAGLEGGLKDGRLIPVTLQFSDGEARTKARLASADVDPHAGHSMTVDANGITLAVDVAADGDGWLVEIAAPGLEFARDAADGPHVDGQGHGHLYLNSLKLQRLYEPTARIGALPSGSHSVTVTLNANDHRAYVLDGKPLSATVPIVVR